MKSFLVLSFVLLFNSFFALAQLSVANVFTDHMVLQRNQPINVWGKTIKGVPVTVSFNGQKKSTKADKNGNWKITLDAMSQGGPFELIVSSNKDEIHLTDLLIGDVWIGSGQSNMEWPLKETIAGESLIKSSGNSNIRLFTVDKNMSATPLDDITSINGWQIASPETTPDFSAVAYNFGKKIEMDTNIPVGLIHSSWGGTDIETWMSWESLEGTSITENLNLEEIQKKSAVSKANLNAFQQAMQLNKGEEEKWYEDSFSKKDWSTLPVPGLWENTGLGNEDGIIWFARSFEISEEHGEMEATLFLGPVDDWDKTYINGILIGETNNWQADRVYEINNNVLHVGTNWIVVKVIDGQGGGGLYATEDQFYLAVGKTKIPLAGNWYYKSEVLASEFGISGNGPNEYPSLLYNAMIAPITNLSIAGVLWYQGENNTRDPKAYQTLFPKMIQDWRSRFGQEFPFYWVQLANFMSPVDNPQESNWAELRAAQDQTLSLSKTGQAIIIDIGEANDIHPRNKKDVGERLALIAEKNYYNMEVIASGPRFESVSVRGDSLIITMSDVGSGLVVKDKYGYVNGFAIAGSDQQYVWARAFVSDERLIIYNPDIKDPVFVRYAWGDNPDDVNLYNTEGLPAAPFQASVDR